MKFRLIPHYITNSVQFVLSISEQANGGTYLLLFEICKSGFSNINGKIPLKYGIDLDPISTHIIVDGVDDL